MEYPTIIILNDSKLDLEDLITKITLPTTGAVAIFAGIVRGQTSLDKTRMTAFLDYEAYQQMAETKMLQVAEEIRKKWNNIEGIAIVQRIGRIYPGIPTTLIACSAAHRNTGIFEAVHYGIDRLKEIVPVWKKEVGPQGEEWVEGNYHPKLGE